MPGSWCVLVYVILGFLHKNPQGEHDYLHLHLKKASPVSYNVTQLIQPETAKGTVGQRLKAFPALPVNFFTSFLLQLLDETQCGFKG